MKKRVLITTALEETWPKDSDLVFLGDWCKKYSRQNCLVGVQHETIPYHWKDRTKFKKDARYLQDFHETLLDRMHVILNGYHQTNHSIKYWRIVVGPWLAIVVPSVFDRWESLTAAMNLNDYDGIPVNDNVGQDLIKQDYYSSAVSLQQDEWNYCLYSDIIKKRYKPDQYQIKTAIRSIPAANSLASKPSLKQKIISMLDSLISKVQSRYHIALVDSYLSPLVRIRLAFKLGQFPRYHSIFKREIPQVSFIDDFRNSVIGLNTTSTFEDYINESILQLLPSSYLEGFSKLQAMVSSISDDAELILTANAHISNDIFKIWCAHQVEYKETKLLVSAHGGCLPSEFSSFTDHERQISDTRIVWHVPLTDNEVRLPANKYVGKNRNVSAREDSVTLIGLDTGCYSYGMQSGPSSSLMLDDFQQKKEFLVSSAVRFNRKIGFYPSMIEAWEFRSRFYDFLDREKISSYPNYNDAIQKSKLIICSYPQTTFSDALFYAGPTVLLYSDKYWTFPPFFNSLLEDLKRVKVVFTDPILAAQHIDAIWDNPEVWWNSLEVQKVRQQLTDKCVDFSTNGLTEWHEFIKTQLKLR